MKPIMTLAGVAFVLALTGCASIALDGRSLQNDASLNEGVHKDYSIISSFEINDKAGWVIGIIPANKPAGDNHDYLSTLLAEAIRDAGGDAVINVKLRAQNQPLDFVVTILSAGIYNMRTVTVTGDVIKFN